MTLIKEIKSISKMLSPADLREMLMAQGMIVAATMAEMVPVVVIPTLVLLATNPATSDTHPVFSELKRFLGATSHQQFVQYYAVLGGVAVVIANLFALLCNKKIFLYGNKIGYRLSTALFRQILSRDYLFFTQTNSASLTSQIMGEMIRIQSAVIMQIMTLNAKLFAAIPLVAVLLYQNFFMATLGLITVGGCYLALYVIIKKKLEINSAVMSKAAEARYRILAESFNGIKEVKLLNLEDYCDKQFATESWASTLAISRNLFMSGAPKHVLEIISIGTICSLIVYVLNSSASPASSIPLLALYAIVGYKLIPIAQQIFASATTISANASALHTHFWDIQKALAMPEHNPTNQTRMSLGEHIDLVDISFTYPGARKAVLNNLNLRIPVGSMIAIVGGSGAGKTTLVDILLGLLPASSGEIRTSGQTIPSQNKSQWQHTLSYVPQDIFLLDASIRENISFGSQVADEAKIQQAIQDANLSGFIQTLPQGIETRVGERGVQISGGQRQRLGIARALYRGAPVIIFDEATSALDGITEEEIMKTIRGLEGERTVVIITHRLSSLKNCEKIFFLTDGQVSDQGTFSELLSRNQIFALMAKEA